MKDKASVSNPANEEFITSQEAAKLLKISIPTLRKYTQDGIIPHYRIGRRLLYMKHEVIAAINSTPEVASEPSQ